MTINFYKYMHVERWGTEEVDGIEIGECYVYPKIDGANASIWAVGGECEFPLLGCGSRNNELGGDKDLMGFLDYVMTDQNTRGPVSNFFSQYGNKYRLFGEWLVPHTIRGYRDDAWRKFYVFDVWDQEERKWLEYKKIDEMLKPHEVLYIEPLCIINNPTYEQLLSRINQNTYLMKDGAGLGEGIVIKNYSFVNRYGRPAWAKIVRTEFKEENRRAFGVAEIGGAFQVEAAIAEEFVTIELIAKERVKIENITKERGKLIPRLLETVFHCVVTEELWHALKKHKDPVIDFKKLRKFVIAEVKKKAINLF